MSSFYQRFTEILDPTSCWAQYLLIFITSERMLERKNLTLRRGMACNADRMRCWKIYSSYLAKDQVELEFN